MRFLPVLLSLVLLQGWCCLSMASELKADEQVLLLPTAAHFQAAAGGWRVPVHAWVFEKETDSLWRRAVVAELLELLELPAGSDQNRIFRSRARMFLVDNEGGKRFRVQAAGTRHTVGPTGSDGHLLEDILLPAPPVDHGAPLPLEISAPGPAGRTFTGRILLIPPRGVSVVSDLDDTIKLSDVGDKQELLANTFLRPFREVPGMADLYRRWAGQGAAFHYLSASPWQLYPAIRDFFGDRGFPDGTIDLRQFRLKDGSFFNLFRASRGYKERRLGELLGRFPQRRFVLVGDAGEADPEIYAELARAHPGRVVAIYIRDPGGYPDTESRCAGLFQALAGVRWQVFRQGQELPRAVE